MVKFLAWLASGARGETEISAAEKLLAFRAEGEQFSRARASPPSPAPGEHGAIIHYRVTPESNRAIRAQ